MSLSLISRKRKGFVAQPAPPGYVPGLGRGLVEGTIILIMLIVVLLIGGCFSLINAQLLLLVQCDWFHHEI